MLVSGRGLLCTEGGKLSGDQTVQNYIAPQRGRQEFLCNTFEKDDIICCG